FKGIQTPLGKPSPILLYFFMLFEYDELRALKPSELVRPVVAQQKRGLIEEWQKEEKLQHRGCEGGYDEAAAEPACERAFNKGLLQAGETCWEPQAPTEP
ncbi:unnamed protein product, partial [Prorocentrum cordatum]